MKQTIEQIKRKIQQNVKGVIPTDNAIYKTSGSNIWHISVIKTAIEESKKELESLGFTIEYVMESKGMIIASYNNKGNTFYCQQIKDLRGRLMK